MRTERDLYVQVIDFKIKAEHTKGKRGISESIVADVSFINRGDLPETVAKANLFASSSPDSDPRATWGGPGHRLENLVIPAGSSTVEQLRLNWTGIAPRMVPGFREREYVRVGIEVSVLDRGGESIRKRTQFGHLLTRDGMIVVHLLSPAELSFFD